jgi:hypothetical protein
MPRSSKRIAAWLASFAMLLGLFAPLISHFFPARYSVPSSWEEICTSQGLTRIPPGDLPLPQAPAKRKGGHLGAHCPFCLPYAGWFAVPSSPGLVLPVAERPRFLPAVILRSPRSLITRATAQSRAPPSIFS